MSRTTRMWIVAGAMALVGFLTWNSLTPVTAEDERTQTVQAEQESDKAVVLREFMRRKLAASSKILEGLVIEDTRLIREGAQTLNEMSAAEKWRVSNDVMYRQFSAEFRRITQKLDEAAQEGNLDQATLKWVDATMSCMECHRFVRGMLITDE
ncbi:hypothetical protein Mal4_45520 [Maioricimonas rarisocia]|uniref:Cytochrome C n=1 Tax=Maioricimonas rarisocia TaxID=2528026 RepID=A0A517ZCL5_9PLAN|nr:hypothetical protein [Maioricimonas rarisocia]QDU40197.1 hypothetical protein Mal4_45520 [Maioricimonas rarisocia]